MRDKTTMGHAKKKTLHTPPAELVEAMALPKNKRAKRTVYPNHDPSESKLYSMWVDEERKKTRAIQTRERLYRQYLNRKADRERTRLLHLNSSTDK